MNIKTKVFIYQLLSFAAFFIPLRFAISYFSYSWLDAAIAMWMTRLFL